MRPGIAGLALVRRHPTMMIGGALLTAMVLAALLAPWLFTVDPIRFNPVNRLKTPSERSEEHTSELQSLMRISYAVFCLNTKTINYTCTSPIIPIHPHTHNSQCP